MLRFGVTTGRQLVRLEEGAETAEVLLSQSSEEKLRALAQAALEAADHIRDYRRDKEPAA